MNSSETSCSNWRLYVIVDRAAAGGRPLAELAVAAIRGGADVIQLRDKAASAADLLRAAQELVAITRPAGIPLIINDRPDIAHAVGASGVHLGQDDLPVQAARAILGPSRLIGKSTHSLEQARAAQAEGADYLGVGPVFATPTKPNYPQVGLSLVQQVRGTITIPWVAIGGIEQDNVERVIQAGARCVAIVRAVCRADDPETAARRLKRSLAQFLPTTSTP